MKLGAELYGELLKSIEKPSAIVKGDGEVVETNELLNHFVGKSVKRGENLLYLLKKKALM